ncbi:MAG TPA: hypothetical protein VG936_18170 [Lacunisphaera sp.]|nr:hypothetical protein [Lacunisphaera sp.]
MKHPIRQLGVGLAGLALIAGARAAPPTSWTPITWNGERALASTSQGWRAVVSLERARLMAFGAADGEANLLLAPPTRANRNMLGGHRLWLGPQSTWPGGWPPPAAWEYNEPESWQADGGTLRLVMGDAGDGWPRLTRVYAWDGPRLVCRAEIAGGTRAVQIVHIFQVPAGNVVSARAHPEAVFPAGYVELPSTAGPFAAEFSVPPHVAREGNSIQLHHTGKVMKFGFRPQDLAGREAGRTLQVRRGAMSGPPTGAPDEGFFTQVYLSGPDGSFIELEQLSPIFAAGAAASFEVILDGAGR